MDNLISDRLEIKALKKADIESIVNKRECLGLPYGIQLSVPEFMDEYYQALEHYILPKFAESQKDYLWFTSWVIINKKDNRIIGGIGSAAPPENNTVMIGYFIDERHEGLGYATEAVSSFTDWIFKHPEVKTIIADTLVDGIGSQKVLTKNGFEKTGNTDEGIRFEKTTTA